MQPTRFAGARGRLMPTLHLADLTQMFLWALEREDLEGAFNATSPQPVPNAAFMRTLRSTLHRPWSPPIPGLAVRLGAFFLGTEAELVLTSRRCVPRRFLEKGFTFQYPDLRAALQSLLAEGHEVHASSRSPRANRRILRRISE